MRKCLALIAMLAASGCSHEVVTATAACAKLEAAGEVKGCKVAAKGTMNQDATAVLEAETTSAPGATCTVMQFTDPEAYRKTVLAYDDVEAVLGPHRYGKATARIFVQCGRALSADHGFAVKRVVDGL